MKISLEDLYVDLGASRVNTLLRDTGVENVRDLESRKREWDRALRGQFSSCCRLGVNRK